jgi:hypothetical protein
MPLDREPQEAQMSDSHFTPVRRPSMFFSLRDATKLAKRARVPCRVWRVVGDRLAEVFFHGERVTHVAFGEVTGLAAVRGLLEYDDDWFLDHGVSAHRHTLLVEWDRLIDAAVDPPDSTQPSPEDETFRLTESQARRLVT